MWGEEIEQSGHRERLRNRFLRSGLEGFQNYEALELLLTFAIPRKDVKPLAKYLINHYGSLYNVLNASASELREIQGIGPAASVLLCLCRDIVTQAVEEKVIEEKTFDSNEEAANFLRMKIGIGKKETLMAIFLDSRRRLIEYKLYYGTVDHTAIYAREVLEQALLCHACSVILAHNHPSGVCSPSRDDIRLTAEMRETLKRLGIILLDHLIVTRSGHTSIMPLLGPEELPLVHAVSETKDPCRYSINDAGQEKLEK